VRLNFTFALVAPLPEHVNRGGSDARPFGVPGAIGGMRIRVGGRVRDQSSPYISAEPVAERDGGAGQDFIAATRGETLPDWSHRQWSCAGMSAQMNDEDGQVLPLLISAVEAERSRSELSPS
jgi:hypothetical protein